MKKILKKIEVSNGDISSQSEHVSEEEEAGKQVVMVVHEKAFKCDQCKNTFKPENGLKRNGNSDQNLINQE